MSQVLIFTAGVLLGGLFGALTVAAMAVASRADEISRNRGE
jgi:hypothetical protein